MRRMPIERFLRYAIPEPMSGCWLWLGGIDKDGYGKFGISGPGHIAASRAAWILFRGEPGKLHVLHQCDNRVCVNPDHLFLGTNLDNIKDSERKGRRGTKLTSAKAAAMRADRASGMTVAAIAHKYGVACATAGCVLAGKIWRYAPQSQANPAPAASPEGKP